MRIVISFLNRSDYWKNYVLANAAKASAILSDPSFIEKVRTHTGFDYTKATPLRVGVRRG